MIKWLLSRWIGKFRRTWNYDANYLRDVLAPIACTDGIQQSHRPRSFIRTYAGRLLCRRRCRPCMAEDCGPCADRADDHGLLDVEPAQQIAAAGARSHRHAIRSGACGTLCRSEPAARAGSRRLARGGCAPLRQAWPRVARFRHDRLAPISDVEICVGPWPRLHAPHCRRRDTACLAPTDESRMNAATEREVASFESHRRALTGLAYHAIARARTFAGSYLRWRRRSRCDRRAAPLSRRCDRLCLDRMKSAGAASIDWWLPNRSSMKHSMIRPAISPTISPSHSCTGAQPYRRSNARFLLHDVSVGLYRSGAR